MTGALKFQVINLNHLADLSDVSTEKTLENFPPEMKGNVFPSKYKTLTELDDGALPNIFSGKVSIRNLPKYT